ncbi:spermidine/putrescine ABC transporter substrate-binding protein [Kosakonia radicincitans UMEnt01/12]|uniref:hypothetical protein n=1 Tax=Kosakonia radicincitans TaxID=283686 RepID=UPI0004614A65|nr:hypothetical protein [Kosakonia radicincitans]KDE37430.1 spermidine/putrescine ABC transporter substrate-binding protein [Kosakonia radicincitans UMEnt01/12]
MKKLHELDLSLQVEIVKAAGDVLGRNFSWPGASDGKTAAADIVSASVDAFLSLYPDDEKKNEPEKLDEENGDQEIEPQEKNGAVEVAQKRKYNRRNSTE